MQNQNQNQIYKVIIQDRNYTSWEYYNTSEFKLADLSILPSDHKLFTNDVFSLDITDLGSFKILHSSIRSSDSIPGVLILKNNKTYGRKNGKLLYKCIPDDKRIPSFIVPYEIKNMGFSKVFINLYVTFQFKEWDEKHPHGVLSQVIGQVDVLDNFYEYQLYCKSLNASIQKFTKDTSKALKKNSHDAFIENITKKHPNIENRTNRDEWRVFTIDPESSLDYDDGFSIKELKKEKEEPSYQLSIYISNVTIWMDALNLWESFSRRISTIYLPDKKRPMLPTILSDCLCSLQSNHTRLAFVMDVFINSTGEIVDIKYSNCTINVFKNFVYEEKSLLVNPDYLKLIEITKNLSKKYKYISNIRNSHDVVSYLMILMNFNTAKELLKKKNGIFRSTVLNQSISIPDELPEDVAKFIKIWNSSTAQYIDASILEEGDSITHDLLEVDAYIHITSPIRRLVDLLNIIQFQQNTNIIQLSENANVFYKKWLSEMEYINTTMRSIRRVQNDCSLLQLCSTDSEIMNKSYEGYVFDKMVRNDGLYQYVVFLPELKLTSRLILRENLNNYEKGMYKLYLFNDEENFKKKIRVQIV